MSRTTQKTVLVTGCTPGGIGAGLAYAFHARGLRVFATARKPAVLTEFQEKGIETIILDVCSDASIAAAVDEVTKLTGGTLDYLVNNSGGGYHRALLDTDIAEARRMFDVNFWSIIAMVKAFSPLVIKAKGVIVDQASIAAVVPTAFQGIYNASKAALVMYNDILRVEMHPFDVKVVSLMTGTVKTQFYQGSTMKNIKMPEESLYKPVEDRVNAVADGSFLEKWMDVNLYSKNVVNDLLKNNPPTKIWRGYYATQFWFITGFFPGWAIHHIAVQFSGIKLLTQRLMNGKKAA